MLFKTFPCTRGRDANSANESIVFLLKTTMPMEHRLFTRFVEDLLTEKENCVEFLKARHCQYEIQSGYAREANIFLMHLGFLLSGSINSTDFKMYIGCFESAASCLLPWNLQQIQRVQTHYLIEQILSHKTLFFHIVPPIGCALSTAMKKSLRNGLR